MRWIERRACSRRILLNLQTNTTPSVLAAITSGSLTAEIGGQSRITRSYLSATRSRNVFMRAEPINSDGVDGTAPQQITSRLGTSDLWTMSSNSDVSPLRNADNPTGLCN